MRLFGSRLIAQAVTFLALSQASATFGQVNPSPAPSPNAGPPALQLPAATAAFQRDALSRLEQQARSLAGGNDAKFTALLRQGLSRLPGEVQKSERGLAGGGSIEAVTAALDPNVQPNGHDLDPRRQSVIMRTIREAREFGTRMVGSTDAPPGSRLETVALLQDASPSLCSGVVVAPGAILTAAHCVCELDLGNSVNQVAFGSDVKAPEVIAYTIPERTRIFPSVATTPPSVYCAHYRKFAMGGRGRVCDRDVALVQFDPARAPPGLTLPRFASNADVDTAVGRVDTPDQGPLLPMEVVGYGVTRITQGSGIYQYGSDGRKRFGTFTFFFLCPGQLPYDCAIPNGAYCMGRTEMSRAEIVIEDLKYKTTDSCAGDSGGPAFVTTVGGEMRLAGLVSRAIRTDGGCGPGGVYSSIYADDIVTWLENNSVHVTR